MPNTELRNGAIQQMIAEVKHCINEEPGAISMDKVKTLVEALSKRADLFRTSDFPVVPGGVETVYSLYCEPDGEYAVYLSSARHGMNYRPHDHGNSWAVVAVVTGRERHRLYERKGDGGSGDTALQLTKEIVLKPGMAIALRKGDMHSIEAVDDKPLVSLHFYHYGFPYQDGRIEYDPVTKGYEGKVNNDPVVDRNIYMGV